MKFDSFFLKRNTFLLLLSSSASFFGTNMQFIAISWFILEKTDNPLYISLLVSVGMIPGLLMSPIAGAVVDRSNKKVLAVKMDFIRAILVLILVIICLIDLPEKLFITLTLVNSLLITLCGNFYFPSISGILKEIFDQHELMRLISINSSLSQIFSALGAAFAGVLLAFFHVSTVLLIDALTFIISGVCLLFLNYSPKIKNNNGKINFSIFEDVLQGLKYSLKDTYITFLFLVGLIPSATIYIINSTLSVYTKEHLNMGSFAYGILDSSYAIGAIVVGITLAFIKKTFNQFTTIFVGYTILIVGFLVIGLSKFLILSALGFAFIGFSLMLINPNRRSLLLSYIKEEYVGRVSSLNWMFYSITGPILGILSTLLLKSTSSNLIFIILGALSLISLIALMINVKQHNQKNNVKLGA
ncbi:MFS transporter [Melghiribacillus thermohalophilus]|uniref:MFS transporter n=1 Tax=Melghiribacillus thermohalophilus TaxID=1324956 RepID=A0A4R3MR53_9BACI|nr:MFS transporter [Melghiribacillus thermohalophilus]TCT17482.1 MFS transporter [Melghiribacillus thermohalophilus]